MRQKLYNWWKDKHIFLRKPVIFILGIALVILAPVIGWLPGPGGIIIFLLGIAVLGSEFDWALSLESFFLKTIPKQVKERWQPTPNWQYAFDVTTASLATSAVIFGYYGYWFPFIYCTTTSILIFIFNRHRLDRLKKYLAKLNN